MYFTGIKHVRPYSSIQYHTYVHHMSECSVSTGLYRNLETTVCTARTKQ